MNKPATSPSAPSREDIDRLVVLFNAGQWAGLEARAREVAARFPSHFVGWKALGLALWRLGKLAEAAEAMARTVTLAPQDAEAHTNLGCVLREKGRLEEAVTSHRRALAVKPDFAAAHSNLGNVLRDQGRLEEAEASFRGAVAIKPDFAEAHANLGRVLRSQGRLKEAVASLHEAVTIRPDFAEAYSNLGNMLRDLNRPEEARTSLLRAIAIKPGFAAAHSDLGNALRDLGRLEEAEASYRCALAINPALAEVHYNLGCLFRDLHQLDEAAANFRRTLAAKPDFAEAYIQLGNVLIDLGRQEEAEVSFRCAIAIEPDNAQALNDVGNILHHLGRLEEAEARYRRALAIMPDFAEAHSNLGNVLWSQGRWSEAEARHRRAIAIKPDLADGHSNMGFILLAAGRLEEGLDKYEWRWRTPAFRAMTRAFMRPQWDGAADLAGKTILVWGEQGLGDQIMWSALLPEIIGRAGTCIVECMPKLVPLLARSFPGVDVRPIDRTSDSSRTDFDCHVPMGSLFRVLGATAPRTDAYLFPDPERVAFWRARLASLGAGPFVGIAWTSSVLKPDRLRGYTGIAEWAPVFATPGAVFINLQHGDRAADLEEAKACFGVTVHDFADIDLFDDLADVAALAAALDLGICVDTAVAAIVAGVGTPLWRLTWRQDSTNNVLYAPPGPSVDYFYRDTGENWNTAFADAARRLADVVSAVADGLAAEGVLRRR